MRKYSPLDQAFETTCRSTLASRKLKSTIVNFVINGQCSCSISLIAKVQNEYRSRFTLKKLLKHITHVHERRYEQVCHICAQKCPTKSLLLTHLKVHSDIKEPPLTCEYCGKSFKQPRNLRTHVRTMHEHDGKVHECPQCQKPYTKRRALKAHIAYHHNVKLHKCNVCEKEFKTSTNLKVSSTPRFRWILKRAVFIELMLQEHMTIHTGVNSYQCKFCPRTFRANGNMYTHLRRMHPNECKAAREAKLKNQMNALAMT